MPSPARVNLTARLTEVESLIRVNASRKARRAANIATEEPALLRSALVMLCSHIEGHFEELIEDIVLAVDGRATHSADFPEAIRIVQVVNGSGTWDTPHSAVRWRVARTCAGNPLISDQTPHVSGLLDTALHTDGFANPGTTDVRRLFASVGIPEVWHSFSRIEPRIAYKNEIDAIVNRRNQIAHGDKNARILASDLTGYLRNFQHTADVFDILSEAHVAASFAGFTW